MVLHGVIWEAFWLEKKVFTVKGDERCKDGQRNIMIQEARNCQCFEIRMQMKEAEWFANCMNTVGSKGMLYEPVRRALDGFFITTINKNSRGWFTETGKFRGSRLVNRSLKARAAEDGRR